MTVRRENAAPIRLFPHDATSCDDGRKVVELVVMVFLFAFLAAVPTGIPAAGVLAALVVDGRLDAWIAVPVLALAAVLGRALLMFAVARGARVLPRSAAANLDYARQLLETQGRVWWAAALLAVPLFPALQVMVVAASAGIRRVPLLLGYGAGRLLTYTIAASAASVSTATVSSLVQPGPWRIALSLALCTASLMIASRFDWRAAVERRRFRFLRRPTTGEVA